MRSSWRQEDRVRLPALAALFVLPAAGHVGMGPARAVRCPRPISPAASAAHPIRGARGPADRLRAQLRAAAAPRCCRPRSAASSAPRSGPPNWSTTPTASPGPSRSPGAAGSAPGCCSAARSRWPTGWCWRPRTSGVSSPRRPAEGWCPTFDVGLASFPLTCLSGFTLGVAGGAVFRRTLAGAWSLARGSSRWSYSPSRRPPAISTPARRCSATARARSTATTKTSRRRGCRGRPRPAWNPGHGGAGRVHPAVPRAAGRPVLVAAAVRVRSVRAADRGLRGPDLLVGAPAPGLRASTACRAAERVSTWALSNPGGTRPAHRSSRTARALATCRTNDRLRTTRARRRCPARAWSAVASSHSSRAGRRVPAATAVSQRRVDDRVAGSCTTSGPRRRAADSTIRARWHRWTTGR